MQGVIVRAWADGTFAYLAVRVNEGGNTGNVEYIGRVQLDEAWQAMNAAAKKAALVEAVQAARARQQPSTSDLGIGGTVTL
jgi:hypothetical protein